MPDGLAPEFAALQRALAGRYSLERELGRGGMGIVFLARDVALDRPVALKLLPPEMAAQPALRQRFLREAQLAAKLSHPNIVPIFAVETVGEYVFFVMAYVEGETLGRRLQARGPLTPAEGTRLIQEVAWALAYAHLRGIVHRDVKPDNILLEHATGRALVSDFGIARRTDAATGTAVGEVLGTAQYMSPEQACGENVDGRSDLYALGVVAFFALSGKLPFDAPDVAALLAMHITRPAPPLATLAPGLPGKLAQAVDRCLAKSPADRFQTGEALAEAVAAATAVTREVPAPIRIWLRRGAAERVPVMVWSSIGGVAVAANVTSGGGPSVIQLVIYFGPLVLYGLLRASNTRRVLQSGYSIEDIRLALRDQVAQRREEVAFETAADPPLVGRVIRWVTYGALGVTAVAAGVIATHVPMEWTASLKWLFAFGVGAVVTVGGAVTGLALPGRRVTPGDPAKGLQARIWNGRLGEWFARLSTLGMRRPALPAAAAAHRPTEIVIGVAADALYAALPRDARRELKDLPAVIRRLATDAQGLRARVDELNALIAGAGEESAGGRSVSLRQAAGSVAAVGAARERLREDLTAERAHVAQRLAAAVAALENIRLDLLRLTAGVGTLDQISADLTAARAIGAEVDAALAGQAEVERLLKPAG
jgi:eukaryotic-like serine/threonine-protein kinase